ncbi:MAG: glycosyltransferase [Eubacteriales bacterium]|nr:glycosyltransferase [Eubacteriales bacterium]
MRVLIIPTNGVRREGINSMALKWISKMNRTDMRIDIAAVHNNADDVIADYEKLGCRVFVLPDRKKKTAEYYSSLFKLIKREKYDAVHVNGSSGIMGLDLFAAKLAGVKVRIAHSRNTLCMNPKADRLLRPLLYYSMNRALACSEGAGKWLFGDRDFEIIHNGIETEKYRPNAEKRRMIREKLGVGSGLVAGFVGNVNEQKNPIFLIDVFECLYRKLPESYLLMVGDGVLFDRCKSHAQNLGISDRVIFVGRSDRVADYMQAMDILLFPSLNEGFGTVALEAQAAGMYVYASENVPTDCDLTGRVRFLPIDKGVQPWCDAIMSDMAEFGSRDNYEEFCRAVSAGHFDLSESASRLRDIYFGVKS